MPIFEYSCLKCEENFEIMNLSSKIMKAICPKCGSTKTQKMLSSFAPHSSSMGDNVCKPESCGLPPGPGGMPPCGAGGCGMM